MSRQRDNCQTCLAPVLKVFINGKPVTLDWPRHEHGDVAVEHALNGTWFARALPVGAPLMPVEQRFRRHDCELAATTAPTDQVARWQENTGAAFRQRWQAERSARAAALRNQRGKRPGKPVTGIRINPGGSK